MFEREREWAVSESESEVVAVHGSARYIGVVADVEVEGGGKVAQVSGQRVCVRVVVRRVVAKQKR